VRPVLVFDSGVGGLSLLRALREALPGVPLVFASDNAAFPYGTREPEALVERVDAVLHALEHRYRPALTVVACNTASTVALPRVRARLAAPVVGVVPPVKPAAAASRTRTIALLATPGTVARPYTDALIRDFASDCTVVRVGSTALVELAEQKLREGCVPPDSVAAALAPLRSHPAADEIDVVALGCTHFPLLAAELESAGEDHWLWIDSSAAIARRAAALHTGPDHAVGAREPDRAVFTRDGAGVETLRGALTDRGLGVIECLDMPWREPALAG
jgi:glutamate racemase